MNRVVVISHRRFLHISMYVVLTPTVRNSNVNCHENKREDFQFTKCVQTYTLRIIQKSLTCNLMLLVYEKQTKELQYIQYIAQPKV